MDQPRFHLYTVNMKYIRNLSKKDDHVFSVSPQIGKSDRPFLGIVVLCNDREYCIPLSSAKPKHEKMKNGVDFSKIFDANGKLVGVLNFNNMIPVRNDVISKVDIKIRPHDSVAIRHYKNMMIDQLTFCQKNQDAIVNKANKLYRLVTENKANGYLKKRCCKFKVLENTLDRFNL